MRIRFSAFRPFLYSGFVAAALSCGGDVYAAHSAAEIQDLTALKNNHNIRLVNELVQKNPFEGDAFDIQNNQEAGQNDLNDLAALQKQNQSLRDTIRAQNELLWQLKDDIKKLPKKSNTPEGGAPSPDTVLKNKTYGDALEFGNDSAMMDQGADVAQIEDLKKTIERLEQENQKLLQQLAEVSVVSGAAQGNGADSKVIESLQSQLDRERQNNAAYREQIKAYEARGLALEKSPISHQPAIVNSPVRPSVEAISAEVLTPPQGQEKKKLVVKTYVPSLGRVVPIEDYQIGHEVELLGLEPASGGESLQ